MRSVVFLSLFLACVVDAYAQHSFNKLDINPTGDSEPTRFTSFKGKTYFVAGDTAHGPELWWTDGQAFGLVADLWPGPGGAMGKTFPWTEEYRFAVAAGKLFFPANEPNGWEIYEYDGVNPPQRLPEMDTAYSSTSYRWFLKEFAGKIYFVAHLADKPGGLYSYDPATGKYTVCVEDGYISDLMVFKGSLVYVSMDSGTPLWRLYRYDPIAKKSIKIPEPNTGGMISWPKNFYVYKDNIFFLLETQGQHGNELYRYDGLTPPRKITDIASGPANSFSLSDHNAMAGNGDKFYFMASDGLPGDPMDLYSYDMLTESIVKVREMNSFTPAGDMLMYGKKLYFTCDSSGAKGLFEYDGNTVRMCPWRPNIYQMPVELAESYGKLFFSDSWDEEVYVYVDSISLDVNEIKPTQAATVYPNPATAEVHLGFTLQQTAAIQISLTDVQGSVVYKASKQCSAGKHEDVVPLSGLPAGLYIYTVINEEGAVLGRGKLVKQ